MASARACTICGGPIKVAMGVKCSACELDLAKSRPGQVGSRRTSRIDQILRDAIQLSIDAANGKAYTTVSRQAHRQTHRLDETGLYKCLVCGVPIDRVKADLHLRDAHGLDPYGAPLASDQKRGGWVHIVSGGLPSLGKRR